MTPETIRPGHPAAGSLRRVAVIGGGVTGLAAAHRLIEIARQENRRLEICVFESGARLGGAVGTRRIGDYLVETGADSFVTDKPWAVELCKRLGLEDRLISTDETFRRSLVLRKGRPVPVPPGFMLLSPSRIWPVLSSPLFSPLGKLRMALEPVIPKRRGGDDESLASFVRRRLGPEALERLVQPLVGGIYTSDPEKLSLQATLPRFIEMEQRHGGLIRGARQQTINDSVSDRDGSGARYGLFVSLPNGISELIDELERRVSAEATLKLSSSVMRVTVSPDGPGWGVTTPDSATERFDALVLAVSAPAAGRLLSTLQPELAELLGRIEYASTAIVSTGHRLDSVRHPLDAFGLVVPAIEQRKILAVSFASRKFPGRAPAESVLLRTFVGGAMQPELMELDDDELAALVRRELEEILGVTGGQELSLVSRHIGGMPQYHVGHAKLVSRIERHLENCPDLALAGNAYHGVGLPDCIHSGEQAAARIMSELRDASPTGR